MANKYSKFSKKDKPRKNLIPDFEPGAILDYHKLGTLTPEEIDYELNTFLDNFDAVGYKSILIITGKGNNSPYGAIVRPIVEDSLKRKPQVKTYRPARDSLGGAGAFEVELF